MQSTRFDLHSHYCKTIYKQGDILSRFQHDEQGRLTAHTQHQNGQQTQSRQYQYGADGNLTEMADSRFGTVFYDYDPLSRLKKTRGVVEESFAHDPAGNLLDQVIGAEAGRKPFDVNGNQLKFHGDSHYEYDEFGRLITEKRGKDQRLITRYEYDCQHRLIKASLSEGSFAHYKYDAFGRRIEKNVTDKLGAEKTTEFVWQGDTLIAETSSEHYQTYIYEPGTFKPMAMLSGEGSDYEVYHYHLDQIGTPTDITDLHGKSVWSVQYRAYGNVLRKHVEEIVSPLRFQGQYFDEETGLHYNRHRYYSPNTGRFVTADPIGLAGGLNNYQYVPNPTGWVDPLGLANAEINGACCGSSYKERLDQTPTNGEWSGPRGESTFKSHSPEVEGLSVPYSNGYPDFRGHTRQTVYIENFVEKVNNARNPRYTLHKEADAILAKRLGTNSKVIKKTRSEQGFTWHEVEDMRTLQLVPTKVNSKFGHLGGISEAQKRGAISE